MYRDLLEALTARRRARRAAATSARQRSQTRSLLPEEEHLEDAEDVPEDLPEGYRSEVRDGIPTVFAPGTYEPPGRRDDGGLFPRQTPQERAESAARIAAEEDRRRRNPPMRVYSFKDYYDQIDSGNTNVQIIPLAIGLIDPKTGRHATGRRYGELYDQRFSRNRDGGD